MTVLILFLNMQVRDTRNFYAGIILQNITYIIKKISYIYLQNRIKSNLQYDDITFFYITTISLEHAYVFDYLLIQNNPPFQQAVSALNFVIIQAQNITNKSIFYLIYDYFKKKGMKTFQNLVIVKYSLVIMVVCSEYMHYLINGLFVFTAYSVYMKYVRRFLQKDNIFAEQ